MFSPHRTQPLESDGTSPWARLEADRAFSAASRARRRAALLGRVRRLGRVMRGLPVYEEAVPRRPGRQGVNEVPLEAIAGTTEPSRAAQFDRQFRPTPLTRGRWQRVWLAVQGAALPPISAVRIGDAYAIRDGHHRVSVARARGALSITAQVA
jgi:hypothetical protein